MPGVRLNHSTLRAADGATLTYVVELPTDMPAPKNCNHCSRTHDRKSLHLRIDGSGDVIVGTKTYGKWKHVLELAGLTFANDVSNPPDVFVGAVARDKDRIVEYRLDGDGDRAAIVPGLTKYESRDKLWRPYLPIAEAVAERADRAATKKLREKRRLFVSTRKEA